MADKKALSKEEICRSIEKDCAKFLTLAYFYSTPNEWKLSEFHMYDDGLPELRLKWPAGSVKVTIKAEWIEDESNG